MISRIRCKSVVYRGQSNEIVLGRKRRVKRLDDVINPLMVRSTSLLDVAGRVLPVEICAIVPLLDDLIGLSDLTFDPVQHCFNLRVSGYPPPPGL